MANSECTHTRVGKEPCVACGGNRESDTKDPSKLSKAFSTGWAVVKSGTNPRLPKEGALDGVLSRNPDPPAMHAGMPRDPDLLARLKRMHEAKQNKQKSDDFEADWDKAMWEIDNTPSDMCKLCKKDMNDPANLAPYQHEAMLETGAFPDYCIHCQKEHGLPGDF